MCKVAIDSDVVVFNVNYRIAPENKSPAGAKDCIATLKYVIKNSETLGINPDQIALGGCSGGAYTAMVA